MPVLESFSRQLSQAFQKLPARDQRALAILLIAALLFGLYFLRDAIVSETERVERQNGILLTQLDDMRSWVSAIDTGANNTNQLMREVGRLAEQQKIKFAVVQPVDNGVNVSGNNLDQSALMAWMAAAQQQGMRFSSLSIRPQSTGVAFVATVEAS